MINTKKISWVLLYLTAFIPVGFSLYYFSEKNLFPALISFSISMSIYTLLIIKDLKFLSSISFVTMLFMSLITIGLAGNETGDIFPNAFDEKVFMLTISFTLPFFLINSLHWTQTKQGIKKLISLICVSLAILMLVVFGTSSPAYYQNFVYTRINISILLILSIFLIIKKKKLLGILGILLSIGVLLLSAGMFAKETYTLNDQEQQEVIAYVDPIAKEMFGYYNEEDYGNFCKYCGLILTNMLEHNPIKDNRDLLGPYVYFDEPTNIVRKGGRFSVEYPVQFQNVEGLMYLTFVVENISSDPSIYGFAFSDKPEE